MPTFNNTDEMDAYLFFNHAITWFGVPQAIFIDHENIYRII